MKRSNMLVALDSQKLVWFSSYLLQHLCLGSEVTDTKHIYTEWINGWSNRILIYSTSLTNVNHSYCILTCLSSCVQNPKTIHNSLETFCAISELKNYPFFYLVSNILLLVWLLLHLCREQNRCLLHFTLNCPWFLPWQSFILVPVSIRH